MKEYKSQSWTYPSRKEGPPTKEQLMFLDFARNFSTIQAYAKHYGLPWEDAKRMILTGEEQKNEITKVN